MEQRIVSSLNLGKFGSDRNSRNEVEASLLEGRFSSEQAKKHVLGILGKTINHHWVQSFKHHESSTETDAYSDKKMVELSQLRDDISQLLSEAEENGLHIEVEALLKVRVITGETSEKLAS